MGRRALRGGGCVTEIGGRYALCLKNTDVWVVERFVEIMGFGNFNGPYDHQGRDGFRRKPFWVWSVTSEPALDGTQILAQWLSPRRLERAYELTGLRFPVKRLPI